MIKYDIAYSLNNSIEITANSWEEAEQKLKEHIKDEGVPLWDKKSNKGYSLEVFDVNEEEAE